MSASHVHRLRWQRLSIRVVVVSVCTASRACSRVCKMQDDAADEKFRGKWSKIKRKSKHIRWVGMMSNCWLHNQFIKIEFAHSHHRWFYKQQSSFCFLPNFINNNKRLHSAHTMYCFENRKNASKLRQWLGVCMFMVEVVEEWWCWWWCDIYCNSIMNLRNSTCFCMVYAVLCVVFASASS